MVTDKEVKEVIGVGAFLFLLYKLKPKEVAGAPIVGNIIAMQPVVYGLCGGGQCTVGETAYIYATFKNTGSGVATGTVGIKINDNIVKQQAVAIEQSKDFTMIYDFVVDKTEYNICGVVL